MHEFKIENLKVNIKDKNIVKNVSFVIKSGEIVAFLGPNGSGKSTLANAMMGHPEYKIVSGSVFINNEDLTKVKTEEKAKNGLFLSLQHIPRIGGLTLATFLHKIYLTHNNDDNISVLEFYVKMRDLADRFSINTELLDKPLTSELSGGEKKLSEILQLLVLKPKFAILDEIDSGVDVDSLNKVFKVINHLKEKENVGFLIISHNSVLLEHVLPNKVYVINKGEIVVSGDKKLAENIMENGFCEVVNCKLIEKCHGACK